MSNLTSPLVLSFYESNLKKCAMKILIFPWNMSPLNCIRQIILLLNRISNLILMWKLSIISQLLELSNNSLKLNRFCYFIVHISNMTHSICTILEKHWNIFLMPREDYVWSTGLDHFCMKVLFNETENSYDPIIF